VLLRSWQTTVTRGPRQRAHSYDVDAPIMQLERHGWGSHVVRSGAGGARVTGTHYPRVPPHHDNKLAGNTVLVVLM